MKAITIVKTGAAHPQVIAQHGDFEDWIRQGLGISVQQTAIADVRYGAPLPDEPQAIVVTGSRTLVTDPTDWSEGTARWLRRQHEKNVPILAICYGHQLLAQALGGTVEDNPNGLEFGTVQITATAAAADDELLGCLPQSYAAQTTHSQSVIEVPKGAAVLAGNAHDSHQAFRAGVRSWGVQFHPEFSVPIMQTYLDRNEEDLKAQDRDVDALRAAICASPAGNLLGRFAEIAGLVVIED